VEGHIARWQVRLAPGANRVEAKAGTLVDSVEWRLEP
jgi:beta-galactosidase